MKRVRNNQKLAGKLIGLFLEDLPELSEQLQSSVAEENLDDIVANSHRIKGSAANLSAILLSETVAKIETRGRDGEIEAIKELMGDFVPQVNELIGLLSEHV